VITYIADEAATSADYDVADERIVRKYERRTYDVDRSAYHG